MKFTLSWLREHLKTDASLGDIAQRLTMVGLEVESVEDTAKALAPIRIARVISAVQHPNADRLRVCQVDLGDGKPVQVVYKKTLAGRPDGDYVTAVFASRFEKKPDAQETVTVERERDGRWHVTGYEVR